MTQLDILEKEMPFYFIETDKKELAFLGYSSRYIINTFPNLVTWQHFVANLLWDICSNLNLDTLFNEYDSNNQSIIPEVTKEALAILDKLYAKIKSNDNEIFYYIKENKSQDWELLLEEGRRRVRLYYIDEFLSSIA